MTSDSCEASTAIAEATASVIMEKKIARTRREIRPMAAASTADKSSAATMPSPTEVQLGPSRVSATATP